MESLTETFLTATDQQNQHEKDPERVVTCVLTADIDNLYPSMPTKEVRQLAREAFEAAGLARVDLWMDLFATQLLNNDVFHAGRWFKQIRGIAQGVSWAPAMANLFMVGFDLIVCRYKEAQRYWRYIDDVCIIWQGTLARMQQMKEELHAWRPNDIKVSTQIKM